jgi:hypothetical protein
MLQDPNAVFIGIVVQDTSHVVGLGTCPPMSAATPESQFIIQTFDRLFRPEIDFHLYDSLW